MQLEQEEHGKGEMNKFGAHVHHNGNKSNELFQMKQESHKIMELPSDSLERTPTQMLFSVGNKILNDIFVRMNGDVPHRAACLLRNILQVIEGRFSNQAESLKTQNNLFKVREGKYQSRINALETLVTGTSDENEVVKSWLQRLKIALQHEKTELEKKKFEEIAQFKRDNVHNEVEISALKQELETTRRVHEEQCSLLELHLSESKAHYENKIEELESHLANARTQVKELKTFIKSKSLKWKDKEHNFESFLNDQSGACQELRAAMEAVKIELLKSKRSYSEDLKYLGMKLKGLTEAAGNYHEVLAENRKLYNEVQDMKGSIRVYCRIRPFLLGQSQNQTTIEFVGDNGELIVSNLLKQGSESCKLFKFNKVFGTSATQEEIYADIQPLIRSVLDGYNVCIFAYGQTGSGKTYTMSGPSLSSKSNWGVNYRALHDLFQISLSRRGSIIYEVGVQMVEIYNEVVRDLLSTKGPLKRIGIWNTAQPNGLVVPDASLHSVNSMKDVLELMNIGQMNRATSVTALNERSSRSHSVLTVHVRGTDLGTNTILRSCLHLVDLAGSERVDRSEATGDRLKEAQHINKSLSALGDVIFALAQKSQHVPYRNSKLTQLLQSSLGGQAKTLMFVQLNPDIASYSETISTLKFAKRVSGVELGAARSNKEGKDVRQLMEQLTYLKDSMARKDEEIERLKMLKENHENSTSKQGMISPRQEPSKKLMGEKAASNIGNCSEYSMDEPRKNRSSLRLKFAIEDKDKNLNEVDEILGTGDSNFDERLSDISDGDLSMGAETDRSIDNIVEYTLFPEAETSAELTPSKSIIKNIPAENTEKFTMPSSLKASRSSQIPHKAQIKSTRLSLNRSSTSSVRKTTIGSSSLKPPKR